MTNERMYTAEELKKIAEYAKGYDLNMRILMESQNESDRKQGEFNTNLFLNMLKDIIRDDEQLLDEITEVDPWDVDEDCLPIMLPVIEKR